jgi:gliding motility-associated-like protein
MRITLKNLTLFLVFFTLFISLSLNSQNLVPNPSFETNTACPTTWGRIPDATPWQIPAGHSGTADYFNSCGNATWNVPSNTYGNEPAATGVAYVGIIGGYNSVFNAREYVQVQLTQTLIAGQCYDVCFKWSLADSGPIAIDNLGAHLSNNAIGGSGWTNINVVPQVRNPAGTPMANKNGWTQLCGTYTAVGGERWITIGNFYDENNTPKTNVPGGSRSYSIYFIDDVSVIPNPCGTGAYGDTICNGDIATIYALGGTVYNWYQLGNPSTSLGTNDTISVSPSTTTQYVVTIDGVNDTVTVYVNPTYNINSSVSICQGDSIFLQGNYQTNAGNYTDTLLTQNGCDSIVNTTLNIIPSSTNTINISICQGDSILLGGTYQTSSGSYIDTLSTQNGCDSILTTVLSIIPPPVNIVNISICYGDSIFLQGNYQTNAGSYIDTLSTQNGCDSILNTVLTIRPLIINSVNVSICPNDSIFLQGGYQNTSGTYTDVLTSNNGCDSLLVTNLSIYSLQTSYVSSVICNGDSILLAGSYQDSVGTYIDTIPNGSINGCDLIVQTTLKVNECEDSIIFIPNVFSPNNDGNNDKFIITINGEIITQNASMMIFNRWGNKLFESSSKMEWDGKDTADGTYYYVVIIKGELYKGTITLIR